MGHQRQDLGSNIVRGWKWVSESVPSKTQDLSSEKRFGSPLSTLVDPRHGWDKNVGSPRLLKMETVGGCTLEFLTPSIDLTGFFICTFPALRTSQNIFGLLYVR
jgi:hypothetical protein